MRIAATVMPAAGKRTYRFALAAILLVTLSILDHCGVFTRRQTDVAKYDNVVANVTHVIDGDTIDVDIPDAGKSTTRIRLWGVDCPEIAHRPGEHDAWYGRDAADFAQEHLEGRRVRIVLDPNRKSRGKYGRLLAFVYFEDTGEMLNEVLLQEGLAYADRRFDHIFMLRFRDLERRAAKSRRGLWKSVRTDQMPAWRQRMIAAGYITTP